MPKNWEVSWYWKLKLLTFESGNILFLAIVWEVETFCCYLKRPENMGVSDQFVVSCSLKSVKCSYCLNSSLCLELVSCCRLCSWISLLSEVLIQNLKTEVCNCLTTLGPSSHPLKIQQNSYWTFIANLWRGYQLFCVWGPLQVHGSFVEFWGVVWRCLMSILV